ncbi:MAG: two-component system response regulator [Planctomycetota bacterium]
MSDDVLITDDLAIYRNFFSMALEVSGRATRVATSGRATLERIRESCPALLVLDMTLLDMPCEEVLKAIRSEPASAGLRVVLSATWPSRYCYELQRTYATHDLLLKQFFTWETFPRVVDFWLRKELCDYALWCLSTSTSAADAVPRFPERSQLIDTSLESLAAKQHEISQNRLKHLKALTGGRP